MNNNNLIPTQERIVIIGAGNMATQLAIALDNAHCKIVQIYNRTLSAAAALEQQLRQDVAVTDDITAICNDATLYIFSVSDSALPTIIDKIQGNDALWIHTAGSMEADIFKNKTSQYGVLYPMQTVHKTRKTDWQGVPIFIEASNDQALQRIEALASSISENVLRCDSAQRKAVNLAAVFACNFSNHMYAIAAHLLESQGLSFDVMKLLIRETELKAEQMPPLKAQTGPAIRHDENVMRKHLALLEGTPEAELYRLISLNIERYGQNENNNSNINPTTKS